MTNAKRLRVCETGCCEGCPECYGYAIGCHNRPMRVIEQVRAQADRIAQPPKERK